MTAYIVTYDLHEPGQKYDDLIEAIKEYGTWVKIQQSVWIVVSETQAIEVRDNLKQYLDSNDQLFVSKVCAPAAWYGYSQPQTDWLKKYL